MAETGAILGINAYHGDAAASLVVDGALCVAVEEERFTRIKHWAGLPVLAIRHCLSELFAGATLGNLSGVAVSRRPRAYLWKKAALALTHPRSLGRALGRLRNLGQISSLSDTLEKELGVAPHKLWPVEHHLAHLASAFFCCPWEEAACLTVDGFGDFVSTMLAVGRGTELRVLDRVHFPHSLGLYYTAITQYLGFPHYGDEYKVMGLAAYGEPCFCGALARLVPAKSGGTFALDLRYFRHLREGVDMTWEGGEPVLGPVWSPALEELLGPPRRPDEPLEQRHKDIAASAQALYEERFFALVRRLVRETGLRRLALAGGCAHNSLANGRLLEHTDVDELYTQPAAGDAGTSLGAALYVDHVLLGRQRQAPLRHAYLGPAATEAAINAALVNGLRDFVGGDGAYGEFTVTTVDEAETLAQETAAAIADGEVVGWFQGRAEWGPRALGNRSILADPRRTDMRELLNLKIKRRESFRPFAPSVLEESIGDWFRGAQCDPFMTCVFPIRDDKQSRIPAVTHVDGTGRLQSVSRDENPLYWALIRAFEAKTGVPMLLNTSFNENEPIVNSPEQALDCFLRTKMDRLVLGNRVIRRLPAEATVAEKASLEQSREAPQSR